MATAGEFQSYLSKTARESEVNGVWFAILSSIFTYPDYVIAPEYETSNKSVADLMVLKIKKENGTVVSQHPVFAYEGKSSKTKLENVAQQGKGYLREIPNVYSAWRYGIIAAGKDMAVIATDGGAGVVGIYQVMKPELQKDYQGHITPWEIGVNRKEWESVLGAIKNEVQKLQF